MYSRFATLESLSGKIVQLGDFSCICRKKTLILQPKTNELIMKRILILLMALMPMMVFAVNKQKVVLSCDLHCQGCCDKIMKNIAFEKGVKDLVCDLKSKTVTVTYDADKTDIPTLLKAFEKIGKPAKVKGEESPKKEAPDTDAYTGASTL